MCVHSIVGSVVVCDVSVDMREVFSKVQVPSRQKRPVYINAVTSAAQCLSVGGNHKETSRLFLLSFVLSFSLSL